MPAVLREMTMEYLLQPAVIASLTGAIGALCGAVGGVLTTRYSSAPKVQEVTNAAVVDIIKHYTQALTDQTREVHSLRDEIADLRGTIEAQNIEIAELNNHIVDLSAALARHGVAPPPRRMAMQ